MDSEDERLVIDAAKKGLLREKLRMTLRSVGVAVDHLSDEELDAAVKRLGDLVGDVGVTLDEAQAAMVRLAAIGIDVGRIRASRTPKQP